jgi:hypothetical protein
MQPRARISRKGASLDAWLHVVAEVLVVILQIQESQSKRCIMIGGGTSFFEFMLIRNLLKKYKQPDTRRGGSKCASLLRQARPGLEPLHAASHDPSESTQSIGKKKDVITATEKTPNATCI